MENNKELKLTSYELFEMGEQLDRRLYEDGVKIKSLLIVSVTENELKSIDEDLYYRNNPNSKDEYIPSEGEIIINFKNLIIKIVAKKENAEK